MEKVQYTDISEGNNRSLTKRWLFLLAFLAILPWIFKVTNYSDYLTYIVVRIMILGLYAMSYDLIFGYTGMLSFGQASFLGGGAYTVAIMMRHLHLPIHDAILPILAALVIGVMIGWIQGFLSSKLGQLAVFIVTFAITETIFLLIIADPLKITNSEDGISGLQRETVLGFLNIKPELNFYYFVLILLCLSYLVLRLIVHLPFGDTIQAIRENPQRARFLGYQVSHYRIATFMISGFFAALAGALMALHERSVGPEVFGVFVSADAFFYTVLGGPGTLIGPVLGAALVLIATEILSDIFRNWLIFFGLSYIALIMFLPKGLFPLLEKLLARQPRLNRKESS